MEEIVNNKLNDFKLIKEGKAEVFLPKNVFYNPVQEFNRDMSILVVDTFLMNELWSNAVKKVNETNFKFCEALSATGLRCIRYALELNFKDKIQQFVANDLAKEAYEMIQKNIYHNKCESKIKAENNDASLLFYQNRGHADRFLIIDIDPYGSAGPFLDGAVQAVCNGGLLLITCTDMAILCGNNSESCFAKYGSVSLRIDSCHEMALRILLYAVNSAAARYGRYVVPLMSMSVDFYIRIFLQVFIGPALAKKSASKTGLVYSCNGCESLHIQKLGNCFVKNLNDVNSSNRYKFSSCTGPVVDRVCKICNHHYTVGGPIWIDPIHNLEFLRLLKVNLEGSESKFGTFKRMKGMIQVISEEILDVPLFYTVDSLCQKLHTTLPSSQILRSAFLNCGFKVSYSHSHRSSLKTNAPINVIWDIFKSWAFQNKSSTIKKYLKDDIGKKLLLQPVSTLITFELNKDAQPLSRELKMLRYQINPAPFWGPKSKPRSLEEIEVDKRVANQGKKLKLKKSLYVNLNDSSKS